MGKVTLKRKKTVFKTKLNLNLRKKLVKFYIWGMACYGAETWDTSKVGQQYLERFGTWCWKRMEKT